MRLAFFVATLAVLLLRPTPARADAASEAKLRDALRSTTTQLRALEDEKARWQKTEADLRQEIQTMHGLPQPPRSNDKATAALNRRLSEQQSVNAKLKDSLARCEAAPKAEAREKPPDPEELKRLQEQLALAQKQLGESEARNLEMYKISKELLDWLPSVGVGGERFFGWKSVELENTAQQYADRLFDQRVKK